MPINFHDSQNRMTYTTREADAQWKACIGEHVEVQQNIYCVIGGESFWTLNFT